MPEARNSERGKRPESDSVDTRFLARAALVAVVGLVVLALLAAALLQQFSSTLPKGTRLVTPEEARRGFANPRLEPAPATDITRLRKEKQVLLAQYQWVDREHGIVRIPIEQAMARLEERQKAGQ